MKIEPLFHDSFLFQIAKSETMDIHDVIDLKIIENGFLSYFFFEDNHLLIIMSKYYAVAKGRNPGIYSDWSSCKKQTDGFPGAIFKGFPTKMEAEQFYRDRSPTIPSQGEVFSQSHNMMNNHPSPFSTGNIIVPAGTMIFPVENGASSLPFPFPSAASSSPFPSAASSAPAFNIQNNTQNPAPLPKMKRGNKKLYVDGGHNAQTGDEAWGRLIDDTGVEPLRSCYLMPIFDDLSFRDVKLPIAQSIVVVAKFNDVESQQNNGAEALAMLIALRIACYLDSTIGTICSDSDLLVKWWSRSLKPETLTKMDPRKAAFIDEIIALRKRFEVQGGQIVKIPGAGNPADLGYH